MITRKPRLTVGLPVYNAERYLAETVESLLSQTYRDFELLIADNASSDRTEDICRGLCRADPRVRYIRHVKNLGAALNHNFVVHEARGELFRWAAHDDLVRPSAFETCVAALDETGSDTVLAFSQTEIVDEYGAHVRYLRGQGSIDAEQPSKRLRALLKHPAGDPRGGFVTPFYGVARIDPLRATRLHQLYFGADRVLIIELALRGKLVEIGEPLFALRQHPEQSGGWSTSTARQLDEWNYPGFRGFPMPQSRLIAGYFGAVLQAPLESDERFRCLAVLSRCLLRDRTMRVMLGEMRLAAKAALSGALQRSPRNGTAGEWRA